MNNMMEVIDLKVNSYYQLRLTLPSGETCMCVTQLRSATVEGWGLGREYEKINAEFIILPSNIPQGKN